PDRADGAGRDPGPRGGERVPDVDDQLPERLDDLLHAAGERHRAGARARRASCRRRDDGSRHARDGGPVTRDDTTPRDATVDALVARARTAQRAFARADQAAVDAAVLAAGWAIMEPARNRMLAE